MADTKRVPAPAFTSPKGVFQFPRLNEPDTKFKSEGEYSVKLILSKDTAKPLIAKLDPLHEKAIEKGEAEFANLKPAQRAKLKQVTSNDYYTEEYDSDEKPTGNLLFNFKMTASGTSKKTGKEWKRRPALFDAKGKRLGKYDDNGKEIVKAPAIWSGTVGKVNFEVTPYFNAAAGAAGISLRLQAAQVIELRSGSARSASEYGFGEEEGYSMEDETPSEETFADHSETPAETPAGDDSGESDF
jgi:hypothetical protein